MVWIGTERPHMKARKAAKKPIARKSKKAYAVRTKRAMKVFARKKARQGEGVIELFVSTYQALG